MQRDLSIEQLARRTDEAAEDLARWRELGLIGLEHPEFFGHEDLERVRVVRLLLERGIALDEIVRSWREGSLRARMDGYLDFLFPGDGRPAYSIEEAAAKTGFEEATFRRIWESLFFGPHEYYVTEDDLRGLSLGRAAMEAGLPEEALIQLMRTWTETLGRAADAAARVVHFYMHETPDRPPNPDPSSEFIDLNPYLEPSILYFLRKGMLRSIPGDLVLHVEEECGRRRFDDVRGRISAAIAFVDLSGFTGLTEAMGDVHAADVLRRFSDIVRDAVGDHDGQIIKQLGDGFMLMFQNARDAVRSLLQIETRIGAEPQFPAARAGVHWGEVLYREGDYVGAAVNVAARITAEATRHQVLLSSDARREIRSLPGVAFERIGARRMRGVATPVELFRACPADGEQCAKVLDPVCGMELDDGEIAARVTLEGREHAFCSQSCLQRFVAAPEAYATARHDEHA